LSFAIFDILAEDGVVANPLPHTLVPMEDICSAFGIKVSLFYSKYIYNTHGGD
jgi:hypothetical protein